MTLFFLLSLYSLIYQSRNIFPSDSYLKKVEVMYDKGIIKNDVTGRAPTGWLSDYATECLSLGVGIQNPIEKSNVFLDTYWNPKNDYNPCAGLINLSQKEFEQISSANYARYWHGHAILVQWLIMIFGLPILKNLIWILNLVVLLLLVNTVIKSTEVKLNNRIVFAVIFPYVAFSDLADLHTSITHSMAAFFCLTTLYFILRFFKFRVYALAYSGFVLGSVYSFVLYGLSPQTIPVVILSWGGILLLSSKINYKEVTIKVICFAFYWFIGYILTFISKWFIVAIFTNYEIFTEVKNQLEHRSSHEISSLSGGVSQHLTFASNLPVFFQSWLANIATFLIHIIDPRYANFFLVYGISIVLILFVLRVSMNFVMYIPKAESVVKHGAILIISSGLFLFIWYALLAQHSFDHATYTYRSLVVWIGGVLGLHSFMNSKKLNRIQEI